MPRGWGVRSAPLLPWRVQCPVRVCATLAARSVGSGRYLVLCLPHFPLPAPRVPRCVWRAVLSGCPLPSLAGTEFHGVCAFRELGPVALLVVPACPLRVCALALPRRPLPPPPPRVVWRAHLARSRHWALVGPFHVVRAPPRVLPRSLALSGVLGGGGGPVPVPPYLAWPARPVGAACRGGGGGPSPGGGGLPLLRGASGVRRCPSPDRLSSGAGSRGTATRLFRLRSVRAWGPSTGCTTCPLAGRRSSLWGWRKGVPGGGAFHHCEGRLRSGAPPPPTAHPLGGLLGSVTHMPWARACGCGGPSLLLWPACPVGAACRGGDGGPSPGRWLATVARGIWCQALSLPLPPVLWGGQPGSCDPCVPGAVGAGVGTQHRPNSVRPCGPALLAVGVAEGRPRGRYLPPL